MRDREWYRVEEVCVLLSLGRSKVFNEIKAGRLRTIQVGKARRIPHDEVLAYVNRAKAEAGLDPLVPRPSPLTPRERP